MKKEDVNTKKSYSLEDMLSYRDNASRLKKSVLDKLVSFKIDSSSVTKHTATKQTKTHVSPKEKTGANSAPTSKKVQQKDENKSQLPTKPQPLATNKPTTTRTPFATLTKSKQHTTTNSTAQPKTTCPTPTKENSSQETKSTKPLRPVPVIVNKENVVNALVKKVDVPTEKNAMLAHVLSKANLLPTLQIKPAEEVNDELRRLGQRQKQIDFGYKTIGYLKYIKECPKNQRNKQRQEKGLICPVTPRKQQDCSKRSWDGQIRKWRRELHSWDPVDENEKDLYLTKLKELYPNEDVTEAGVEKLWEEEIQDALEVDGGSNQKIQGIELGSRPVALFIQNSV